MQAAFRHVIAKLGVDPQRHGGEFYVPLKQRLAAHINFKQKKLFQVVDKLQVASATRFAQCGGLRVAVAGAGPVGLRTAIELALLGAEVRLCCMFLAAV